MSISINFNYLEAQHKVYLEPTNAPSEKAISIQGRDYKILGSEEEISLLRSHIASLETSKFESVGSFEASLIGFGSQEKVHDIFQKMINHTTGELGTNTEQETVQLVGTQTSEINQTQTFNAEAIEVIIGDLIRDLGRLYPSKEVALDCIEHLTKNLEKYKQIDDPDEFVKEINKNLKNIAHDEHLRLRFQVIEADNYDMTCEILPDNVGKIHMRGFGPVKISTYQEEVGEGEEARTKEFAKSIAKLKKVKCVVIDLRENDGGHPEAAQLLCSYFMKENIELSSIQNTIGDPCSFTTLSNKVIPEEERLLEDIPVYILTSEKTFSAAEKFTNDMQILGRATVIGEERTRGGANSGTFPNWGLYPDSKGQLKLLDVCIPTGQTVNLNNKINWEGIGLTPNIVVSSAEDAQKKALELIEKHETSLGSLLPTKK